MSTQVHRFHDTVAVYVGDGQTTYLTPDQAIELGQALAAFGYDVNNVPFVESTLPTYHGRTIDDMKSQ